MVDDTTQDHYYQTLEEAQEEKLAYSQSIMSASEQNGRSKSPPCTVESPELPPKLPSLPPPLITHEVSIL